MKRVVGVDESEREGRERIKVGRGQVVRYERKEEGRTSTDGGGGGGGSCGIPLYLSLNSNYSRIELELGWS